MSSRPRSTSVGRGRSVASPARGRSKTPSRKTPSRSASRGSSKRAPAPASPAAAKPATPVAARRPDAVSPAPAPKPAAKPRAANDSWIQAVPKAPHAGLPLTLGLASAIGLTAYRLGGFTFATDTTLTLLHVVPAAMIAWDVLSRAKSVRHIDRFANLVHVWLAYTVVTQLLAAFPAVDARFAPLKPVWALAGQALLAWALAKCGYGRLGSVEALPAVALFSALHSLPLLGGSLARLVGAYVPAHLTVAAIVSAAQLWLNSATAGLAMTRLVGAVRHRSSTGTRTRLTQLCVATLLLSTAASGHLLGPILSNLGAPAVLSGEVAQWVAIYLLAQAVRV